MGEDENKPELNVASRFIYRLNGYYATSLISGP